MVEDRIPPRIMIAAPAGRSGKTTVSIGLCSLFRAMGLKVQPFKKGPDYIDPSWLTAASGNNCRNLDAFMMGEKRLLRSFETISPCSDIAIIEGNMGLYDGIDRNGKGSSAHLSRLLKTPVILVVNTARMSRSIAALVRGYQDFEPDTEIRGVILNNVSGERHASKLTDAIERYCRIPVLGTIPKNAYLNISERHLGLVPFRENESGNTIIKRISDITARYLDLDGILSVARSAREYPVKQKRAAKVKKPQARIGVVYDRVFNFYYPENLEALRTSGAELVMIDSLHDKTLPDIDGLYIGGGFPELHLQGLSANRDLMRSIALAIEDNLPVYAECAGLMYLCSGIRLNGKVHEMAGVIPSEVVLSKRPQGHGYVHAEVTGHNPFFADGTLIRGHEFHYSQLTDPAGLNLVLNITRGRGVNGSMDGIIYKNLFASYLHIHALGSPAWADNFVAFASGEHAREPYLYHSQRKEADNG
ncbi:MAG: hydrogenobyrinic acid a,c-diamide synthase (glutamine-hydrolyzing) [Syntrophorhabdaceae bacterium]|nr:hydrogenobyrinic acid a,c-diamide synthase (glutamine-hydrolyzing) [Syntrophorhabdaceae bacterium]MDD5243372.1 hydrogenobyrinic acid a,c-diamide synthase (glutamine-hydrolyzing) [Syntrophorhabdaceae bacterium]